MNEEQPTEQPEVPEIPAKPEDYQSLLATITPEIRERLMRAVELGKWENGERLTPAQLEHCLQAVIAWDHQNLPPQERVAYIEGGKGKGRRGE